MGAGPQSGVHVAPGIGRARQHVAVGAPHGDLVGRHRHVGVGQRRERLVGHFDQGGRVPGGLARLGHHDGQHVARVRGAPALGDEHRPVLVDDAHAQVAGDIGGREDGDGPGRSQGPGRVDADDVGPGVVGEAQGGVQQAGRAQVVDVAPVAQGQRLRLVLGPPAAYPASGGKDDLAARGDRLDGVEDLDVPGAAAKMGAEMAGHVLPGQGRAFAVDLRLGPHDDTGDAETALEPARGGEGLGVAPALGFVEALERGHGAALDLSQRGLARHLRLAVEQDRATPALAARRAAVLR